MSHVPYESIFMSGESIGESRHMEDPVLWASNFADRWSIFTTGQLQAPGSPCSRKYTFNYYMI